MSFPLDEDLWSGLPRSFAFAAPEMLRTLSGQRATFAASSDHRTALLSVLDDAVEMRILTVRDVQRVAAYLDRPADARATARRYYREALADREASHLVAFVFGVAATVASPASGPPSGGLTESDLATFLAATMAMGPVISVGVLLGAVARRQDVPAHLPARA